MLLPSQDYLKNRLRYDAETGDLFWLEWAGTPSSKPAGVKSFNKRFAGKPAFIAVNNFGYRIGSLEGRRYSAHRVIWKFVHGIDPDVIDHINGIRSDNRLANLRDVSQSINLRNRRLNTNNKSGHAGIYRTEGPKPWRVQIRIKDAMRSKSFSHLDQAVAWRNSLASEFGFLGR